LNPIKGRLIMTNLRLALLVAAWLTPTALLAQATPTPPPQSPAQQEGAPAAPGLVTTPPQGAAPGAAPAQGETASPAPTAQAAAPLGPANICRELVAFLEAQAKAQSAPPAPAAAGAAASLPVPPAQPAAPPKPLPMPLEQAQGLAGANDIPGCRDAAQRLRQAGVALPPGLIALAALKVELLQTAQP
jgi:hypothetical protein